MNKLLFDSNGVVISSDDLLKTLQTIGVKKGDTICVHSQIFNFGKPLLPKNELLQCLVEILCQSVGVDLQNPQKSTGTILMPVFTPQFCDEFNSGKLAIYDKKKSSTNTGILNEYFRQINSVWRTNDPICSYAIIGKNINDYKKQNISCYDKNSVCGELLRINAKIIGFGSSSVGYTFFHYIEEACKIPYRLYKTFSGIIISEDNNKTITSIKWYVTHLEKPMRHSPLKVKKEIIKNEAIKISKIERGEISAISCRDFYEITRQCVEKDPYYFVDDVYLTK